jgi:competence protein ComGC
MEEENKICPACNKPNKPESKFCKECGTDLAAQPEPQYPQPPFSLYGQPPPGYPGSPFVPGLKRSAGLCVAALILGILAWAIPFVGPLLAVLAIIFGALGIREVNRKPQELSGKGMGVAGLVLGITGLVVSILVIVLMFSVFHTAQSEADRKTCKSNMRTVISVSDIYCAENEEYPTSIGQLVPEYMKKEPVCPAGGIYRVTGGGSSPLEITCSEHGSI